MLHRDYDIPRLRVGRLERGARYGGEFRQVVHDTADGNEERQMTSPHDSSDRSNSSFRRCRG